MAASLLSTDEGHLALGFSFLAPLVPGVDVAQTCTSQVVAFRTKDSNKNKGNGRKWGLLVTSCPPDSWRVELSYWSSVNRLFGDHF